MSAVYSDVLFLVKRRENSKNKMQNNLYLFNKFKNNELGCFVFFLSVCVFFIFCFHTME